MMNKKMKFALGLSSLVVLPAVVAPVVATNQYTETKNSVNLVSNDIEKNQTTEIINNENIIDNKDDNQFTLNETDDLENQDENWWLTETEKQNLNTVKNVFASSNYNDVVNQLNNLISKDKKSAINIVNTFANTKEQIKSNDDNLISENNILGYEISNWNNSGINFKVNLNNTDDSKLYINESTIVDVDDELTFRFDTKNKGIYFYDKDLLSSSIDEILTSGIDLSKYSAIAALSKNEQTQSYELFISPIILNDSLNEYQYMGARMSIWSENDFIYSVTKAHWAFRINLNLKYDSQETTSPDVVDEINEQESFMLKKFNVIFNDQTIDSIANKLNLNIKSWSTSLRKELALSLIQSKFRIASDFDNPSQAPIEISQILSENQIYGIDSIWSENNDLWFNIKLDNSIANYKTFLIDKTLKAGYQILTSDFKVKISLNSKTIKFIDDQIFTSNKGIENYQIENVDNYGIIIGLVKENDAYKLHWTTNTCNSENENVVLTTKISYYTHKFVGSNSYDFSAINFMMPADIEANYVDDIDSQINYSLPSFGTFCSSEMALDYIFQTGSYDFGPTQNKRIKTFIENKYKNVKVAKLVSKKLIDKQHAVGVYELVPIDGYKWIDKTTTPKTITIYVDNFNIY